MKRLLLSLACLVLWLLWHRYESPYIPYPVRCDGGMETESDMVLP